MAITHAAEYERMAKLTRRDGKCQRPKVCSAAPSATVLPQCAHVYSKQNCAWLMEAHMAVYTLARRTCCPPRPIQFPGLPSRACHTFAAAASNAIQ